MSREEEQPPWYQAGLDFTCTKCGACCTGAPGYVWVESDEISALAEFRGETIQAFSRKYVRRVGDRLSLVEKPGGDCIFWDAKRGCTVYQTRPAQCRTWPFWPENVESPQAWEHVCRICPGSGKGEHHTLVEIEDALSRTPL